MRIVTQMSPLETRSVAPTKEGLNNSFESNWFPHSKSVDLKNLLGGACDD